MRKYVKYTSQQSTCFSHRSNSRLMSLMNDPRRTAVKSAIDHRSMSLTMCDATASNAPFVLCARTNRFLMHKYPSTIPSSYPIKMFTHRRRQTGTTPQSRARTASARGADAPPATAWRARTAGHSSTPPRGTADSPRSLRAADRRTR